MNNEIIPLQPSSNDSIQPSFICPTHNMNGVASFLSPPLQILNRSLLNWYATKKHNEQPLCTYTNISCKQRFRTEHFPLAAAASGLNSIWKQLKIKGIRYWGQNSQQTTPTRATTAMRPVLCAKHCLAYETRQLAAAKVLCPFKKPPLFSADLLILHQPLYS